MEENDCQKEVEKLEKEARFKIITMDDDVDDGREKKILDDAKEEITKLYEEFREWLADNLNSEETGERFERLKQETQNLLARTKASIQKFKEREDVQAGKEKAIEVGTMVKDKVSDGFQEVMRNDYVSMVVESVGDTIDTIVHDEHVQHNVKKLKKGTLKVAESAFNGLKRVLDTDEDQDSSRKG